MAGYRTKYSAKEISNLNLNVYLNFIIPNYISILLGKLKYEITD